MAQRKMKCRVFGVMGIMVFLSGNLSAKAAQLDARQSSSDCVEGLYETKNGLGFDVYCGADVLYPEVGNEMQPSVFECMDACSWHQPACFGVTYYAENQTCSFRGEGVEDIESVSDSDVGIHSAFANATQMEPLDLNCPYRNHSLIETAEGLPFHIYCNQDIGGSGDYFPWGVTARAHTETMEECMEICARAHPLCLAVAWNGDLSSGYGNCYLKNTQDMPPPINVDYITHTGLVNMPVIDTCSTSKTPKQITSNDKTFNVTCFVGRVGSENITSVYSADIGGCVDACASYVGPESCLAVYYDNSFKEGFDNCYLLNVTGTDTAPLNSTYAELVSGTPSGSSPLPPISSSASPSASSSSSSDSNGSGDGSGSSASKAWIAGPVVGVVAAVAFLAAGIFWWRRRTLAPNEQNLELFEKDASDATDAKVGSTGSPFLYELPPDEVVEMEARESRHELPG